jgi:fibronectin type 3 domain-containing protein
VNGSAVEPTTTYTDSNVQSGMSYYYVVTAVDGSGNESTFSNEAVAGIPTP